MLLAVGVDRGSERKVCVGEHAVDRQRGCEGIRNLRQNLLYLGASHMVLHPLKPIDVMSEVREPGRRRDPPPKLWKAGRDHFGHGERHCGPEPCGRRAYAVRPRRRGLIAGVDGVRHRGIHDDFAHQSLHAFRRVKPVGERIGGLADVALELGQVGEPRENRFDGSVEGGLVRKDTLAIPREPLVDFGSDRQRGDHVR